jgi:microcystin-dependent protein
MEPFIAQIMMFGGNFAPRGWAFCEGQLLPISNNAALFSLIGTIYGGDGRTTFALPDMRGRSPIGQGHGSGLTPRPFGQRGGVESVTLNQLQMPSHTHSATVSLSGGAIRASTSNADKSAPAGGDHLAAARVPSDLGSSPAYSYISNSGSTVPLGGFDAPTASAQVGNTGGSQSHENMPPFQVIPFVIALQGVFPSRN